MENMHSRLEESCAEIEDTSRTSSLRNKRHSIFLRDTKQLSSLRRYAKSRKVAGSISNKVIEIFD
jgi:hypothetical protein